MLAIGIKVANQLILKQKGFLRFSVQSLGWEDPLEKKMATHSIILVWIIPRTEEPDKLQFMGSQRVRHD